MKPDTRRLLSRCVEDGIASGIRRAHKNTEAPTRQQLEAAILDAVLAEIDEWFVPEEPRMQSW